MDSVADDLNRELMLDGNAVAGELAAVFGIDMTTSDTECAGCGRAHQMGSLLAFTLGPGIVLRCPSCESVMIKLVRTPHGLYLDARGVAVMHRRADA